MKISLDTELEELSELKATIAIIEEAVKRRENPEPEEEIKDNKAIVKEIILDLAKLAPNQPINIDDVIKKTNEYEIPEKEAIDLINELQKSEEI